MTHLKMKLMVIVLTICIAYTSMCNADDYSSSWATTKKLGGDQGYKTEIHVYLHDITTPGPTQSAVKIAEATTPIGDPANGFGLLVMSDDNLTVEADGNSAVVGRGQGMWGFNGRVKPSIIMDMTFTFTEGRYSGSSVTFVGNNPAYISDNREVAVAGGTGLFRMCRGYAFLTTKFFNGADAIISYKITIFHDSF